MIYRFAQLDEAAIFCSKKCAEGYFAEVIHLHSGHIWGSLATQGFSVIVSEHAVEDGQNVSLSHIEIPPFLQFLGTVLAFFTITVMGLSVIGLFILGISILIPAIIFEFVTTALVIGVTFLCFLLFFAYIWTLLKGVELYRLPKGQAARGVRILVAGVALTLICSRLLLS